VPIHPRHKRERGILDERVNKATAHNYNFKSQSHFTERVLVFVAT